MDHDHAQHHQPRLLHDTRDDDEDDACAESLSQDDVADVSVSSVMTVPSHDMI